MVFLGAPSALHTSLALRQAIWRKQNPSWPVCGIPDVLYADHGSDFTSIHLEQVAAALRIKIVHSTVGRPQVRGQIERFFGTTNTELLPQLAGRLIKAPWLPCSVAPTGKRKKQVARSPPSSVSLRRSSAARPIENLSVRGSISGQSKRDGAHRSNQDHSRLNEMVR